MKFALAGLAALLAVASPALAQQAAPAPAAAQAQSRAPLTVDSKIEDLTRDPRTDAVLQAHIPQARASEIFATAGAELTLRQAMGFEPSITEAKLRAIAEDLAKVQTAG